MTTPNKEIEIIVSAISSNPGYLNPSLVCNKYRQLGLEVIPDPFSKEIPQLIIQALKDKKPFSMIRIGDGEANLLSFGVYPETPILNLKVAKKIIRMQQDTFLASPLELIRIQNLIHQSIFEADVVGLIGLWRPQKRTVNDLIALFLKDQRGISGHWRAVDYLLYLAKKTYLDYKILTSAHLYFSILEHIQELLEAAEKVILITNRSLNIEPNSINSFSAKTSHIIVGSSNQPDSLSPGFLLTVKNQLPTNMSGTLCLIGAGPWSEIYCTWIKHRGGVAVDIGSAFDLLEGKITRPIHKILKLDKNNRYNQ